MQETIIIINFYLNRAILPGPTHNHHPLPLLHFRDLSVNLHECAAQLLAIFTRQLKMLGPAGFAPVANFNISCKNSMHPVENRARQSQSSPLLHLDNRVVLRLETS